MHTSVNVVEQTHSRGGRSGNMSSYLFPPKCRCWSHHWLLPNCRLFESKSCQSAVLDLFVLGLRDPPVLRAREAWCLRGTTFATAATSLLGVASPVRALIAAADAL